MCQRLGRWDGLKGLEMGRLSWIIQRILNASTVTLSEGETWHRREGDMTLEAEGGVV
jgi:hypothetical protein